MVVTRGDMESRVLLLTYLIKSLSGDMFIDFRKRERENINQLPPICTPTGDRNGNLFKCPDQGSNPQPFSTWDNAPTNWATWLGPVCF